MTDRFLEQLGRFTPDGAGLDRDALLFAAGRASARPPRSWKVATGLLAASQLLTLVLLWPHREAAPPGDFSPPPTPSPAEPLPEPSPAPRPSEMETLRTQLLAGTRELPPLSSLEAMIPPEPPLHAFSAPPPSLSN